MSKYRIRQDDFGRFIIERRNLLFFWDRISIAEFMRTNTPFNLSVGYDSLEDAERALMHYLKHRPLVKKTRAKYYDDPADTKVGKELLKEVEL
jgi:hypothetical protein